MKAVVCDFCGVVFAQQGDPGTPWGTGGTVKDTEWAYILTYAPMDHDVRPENHRDETRHLHRACVVPWLDGHPAGAFGGAS